MTDNLKKKIKDIPEKNREFGVVLESIDSNVTHIVEVVDMHTNQLSQMDARLGNVEQKLENVDGRLAAIEITLESVNLPMLKEKVLSLEKRVAQLEAKQ